MTTFALHNLGCSKNQIDGERIAYSFCQAGYSIVADFSIADVIIVNTCAFIQAAQEEAIEAILEMTTQKNGGKCKKLIVSGCFSERYRDQVKVKFPDVDLWVGVHDWETLLSKDLRISQPATFKRELSLPRATQYLKIAEGCSHGCTFCAIPNIRGPFKSRPVLDIITEAQWLEGQGTRELILVAQDSSFYGRDNKVTLEKLLESLLKSTTIPWIRIMYLHPRHVGNDLLNLIASEKRLCPYFDIPLQHSADTILKAMNRRSTSRELFALIEKIRSTVPNAGIRSAFILGFPGETETDFNELIRFIESVQFDKLGVFPFSAEEGTKAYAMRPRPRRSTAQRRCDTIMQLQQEISSVLLSKKIGSAMDIIVDGTSDDPLYPLIGRTRIDAPEIDGRVLIDNNTLKPGSIVKMTITGSNEYDLFATPISKQ